MSAPARLAALRQLLAGRFPSAALPPAVPDGSPASRALPTGLPAIDEVAGGLPRGAVTEIVCAAPSCGGQLLLGQLLAATRLTAVRVALVDGHDAFDPASFPADLLAHLVWVRGGGRTAAPVSASVATWERRDHMAADPATLSLGAGAATSSAPALARALQAADLLARDANLGLVVLDLRAAGAADFRRTPATHWYRLQHAAETAGLPLVVLTPRAAVPSARIRFVLGVSHALPALTLARTTLLATLAPRLQRHRLAAAV
jgi:hypothetical protein